MWHSFPWCLLFHSEMQKWRLWRGQGTLGKLSVGQRHTSWVPRPCWFLIFHPTTATSAWKEKSVPTSEEPSHWVNRQHLWRNLLKRNRLETFWCFLLLILKSEPGARHRILRMLHFLQDLKLWRTLNRGVYYYMRTRAPPQAFCFNSPHAFKQQRGLKGLRL